VPVLKLMTAELVVTFVTWILVMTGPDWAEAKVDAASHTASPAANALRVTRDFMEAHLAGRADSEVD
jgi:hypothetical protein